MRGIGHFILFTLIALAITIYTAGSAQTNTPIPWDQIGAKAGADYKSDGLAVTAAGDGARLNCVFQHLQGDATAEGLWLASTVSNAHAILVGSKTNTARNLSTCIEIKP
jgi:hypothetical protein